MHLVDERLDAGGQTVAGGPQVGLDLVGVPVLSAAGHVRVSLDDAVPVPAVAGPGISVLQARRARLHAPFRWRASRS
ncbi:hypothetical protein GCM10009616_18020 [Microlunatus lacustris]